MKFLKYSLLVALFCVAGALSAQDLKFGHIDVQGLITQLPDKIAADQALQKQATDLQNNLKVMTEDLEKKYTEYLEQRETMDELIRATKEKEIQDYDQRIKNFNMLAQQNLQKKEQELLQPIIEKVQKAIDAVGAENGLIYIFDVSSRVVIYHSDKSIDCAPLVKAKLDIK
ncbi:periplasmic chaperone for outer membrane proteins Skp [Breznakibacter xylanolyticus]|uniref:Periplasmic chaperone for outer membrane proteins Skp n=1 Tax=Breznakibacter xylanolyticus TaxID=990 RepID=A0A2W7NBJ5_9BACT|nr:OmpH family outer membrane protein [Breznakibacter xylanolyticus]MBN2743533.1 OmpH family outer membrane protein [Marinilabiliaceae bacterium]PZX17360.1 periplasmic chaperone for outer membrane proteins Skp [Breznakibacter xylanolyticus]